MSINNLDNLTIDTTIPEPENVITPIPTTTDTPEPVNTKPIEYVVTQEDIEFLQKQISISDENAQTLLLKNKGNFVNAIIDFYQINYKNNDVNVGIAQPTITAFSLENDVVTQSSTTSRTITYDKLESNPIHKFSKTYLFVCTGPDYSGFTKKKKYTTLPELIKSECIPGFNKFLMHTPNVINISELVGRSNEILEKWSMPASAIVLCPEQIVSNTSIVENKQFNKLNKVATQIARHSGIIQEHESIIYPAYIIGNVNFD